MTKRPLNVCNSCGNTWYPRGRNLSWRCPHCGSRDTKIDLSGLIVAGCLLGVVGLVLVGTAFLGTVAETVDRWGGRKAKPGAEVVSRPNPAPVAQAGKPRAEARREKATNVPPPPEPAAPLPKDDSNPLPSTPEPAPVAVAPPPRLYDPLPPPPSGWSSDWRPLGACRVRIRSAALTRVPVVDDRGRRSLSADRHFGIWVEIENVTPGTIRAYRRWTPSPIGGCTLLYPLGHPVSTLLTLPDGTRREWFGEYTQPLTPGGPGVVEILLFAVPVDGAGHVTLRLEGERIGERGVVTFDIPATAWKP